MRLPNICFRLLNIIYAKEIQIHSGLFVIDRHALNGAELILLDFKAVFPTNSAIAYVQEALTFPHPSIEEK